MAILGTYWPSTLLPDRCRFGRSRNDVLSLSPSTRQEHVIRRGRPLWRASLSWSISTAALEAELRYFLDGLEGFAGAVFVWDFAARQNAMSTGDVNFTTASAVGDTAFSVTGATPGATLLKRGDYVQASRRLYLVGATVVVDGSGNAVIPITTPSIIGGASVGIRLVRCACEMRLASQEWDTERTAGDGFQRVSADFIETVETYT